METSQQAGGDPSAGKASASASHETDAWADGILLRTEEAGKTYRFFEDHDPRTPVDAWFQDTLEGKAYFVVFYTQACRWSRCLSCNLSSLESQYHVPFDAIMSQVDHVFNVSLSREDKLQLRKIILSNNGSVLDQATFSTTALIYFVARMNMECPNVTTLTLETRPEYVDLVELEMLARALKEGKTPTQLELAVGFEAYDEHIRNQHFKKGLDLKVFEKMVEDTAEHHYRLKVYFMQKPVPGMTEEEAVEDVRRGIIYLDQLARRYGVQINMHLNPTYVAKDTPLEAAFREGAFQPPLLDNVRRALLEAEGRAISVFIGLYDEQRAVPGGGLARPGEEELLKRLQQFNETQDFNLLRD